MLLHAYSKLSTRIVAPSIDFASVGQHAGVALTALNITDPLAPEHLAEHLEWHEEAGMLLDELSAFTALITAPRVEILSASFCCRFLDDHQIMLAACLDASYATLDSFGRMDEEWRRAKWKMLIIETQLPMRITSKGKEVKR